MAQQRAAAPVIGHASEGAQRGGPAGPHPAMRPHEIAREAAGLLVWIRRRELCRRPGAPAYMQHAMCSALAAANSNLARTLDALNGLASIW
jgi:hypothetical protein